MERGSIWEEKSEVKEKNEGSNKKDKSEIQRSGKTIRKGDGGSI